MTTLSSIELTLLSRVTGGNSSNVDAKTAFDAMSSSYANGNNQNIMGGATDDGFEMRLRSDNGSGIACTKSFGEKPTYACKTFTGE